MTDQSKQVEEAAGAPVTINKYAILPNDIVLAPRGKVMMVGFAGKVAYAWVMHHPHAPVDMQLLTVPSEQVITLEADPLFDLPLHVGSFFTTDATKLLPSAWHVFMFMPKSSGKLILPN